VNGVDLTPSLGSFGSAFTAFAGAATLSLLNNISGTDPALGTELIFAGIRIGGSITIDEHRTDAYDLEVKENGLAVEGLGDFTWAWSPNLVEIKTSSLPGEPDFGDIAARLTISEDVVFNYATNAVRPEGLRQPRIDRAFHPATTADLVYRSSPSGFAAVDGDLHLRIVFRVDSGGTQTQRLFFLEDPDDATLRFGVEVSTSGGLTVYAPSGYAETVAAAVVLDRWHLLDVSLDRDGSGGNALIIGLLDGSDLAVAAYSAPVSDIPAGAEVTVFDDAAHAGAATETSIAFLALTRGRVLLVAQHVVDALALEVMPT
jgi:hypothetical protein